MYYLFLSFFTWCEQQPTEIKKLKIKPETSARGDEAPRCKIEEIRVQDVSIRGSIHALLALEHNGANPKNGSFDATPRS